MGHGAPVPAAVSEDETGEMTWITLLAARASSRSLLSIKNSVDSARR